MFLNNESMHEQQEGKMSTAGHGGLSQRALPSTHAAFPSRGNGAKKHLNQFVSCSVSVQMKISMLY